MSEHDFNNKLSIFSSHKALVSGRNQILMNGMRRNSSVKNITDRKDEGPQRNAFSGSNRNLVEKVRSMS